MKKLLSIILALTMVIALVPAAFAADEITENNYVFNISSIKDRTVQYSNNRAAWSFGEVDSSKSEPFRVAGCRSIKSNGSMTDEHMNIPFIKNNDYSIFDIHIVVTVDGAVQPTIRHKLNIEGIDVDFYLYRLNDPNAIDWTGKTYDDINATKSRLDACLSGEANAQFLGTINTYAEKWTGTVVPVELNKVNVTPGEYILVCYGKFAENVEADTQGKAVLDSFNLKKLEEDTELTNAFTAKETTHTATAKNVYGYKSTDTANVAVTHEAVTTDTVIVSTTDTENFLYWAQGLTNEKKILSFKPSFEYTPAEGNNYLVAVYRDSANKAEFFNANGQREAVLLTDGTAPALPERVGYEPADAWVDLDGNTVAPGTKVTVNGYNSYVPNYGERISVTVNGTSYNYGDPVTLNCNDDTYYKEGKYFKGWKKDNVIVSTDDSYSFLAYKDTTVTAEWADEPFNFSGNGRKIVLDAFNNALMAEFIGFGDNAVEKGIMFTDTTGTRNIAMTTGSNQFVIIPDEAGTYNGYAIVEDSEGTQTLVTDGEYTKGN